MKSPEESQPTKEPPAYNAKSRWFKRRYELFSKYDDGIRVSEQMWFSVTPEQVAMTVASRVKSRWPEAKTVIDICGGAGGNAIAFARMGFKVIYVDIDAQVLQDAAHNANIYKCSQDIDFHLGDALSIDFNELCDPQTTVVHASPEWGGPTYKNTDVFDVNQCGPPVNKLSRRLKKQGFNKVVMFLPRMSDLDQLAKLGAIAVENIHVDHKKNPLAINAIWDGGDNESEDESSESESSGGSTSESSESSDSDSEGESKTTSEDDEKPNSLDSEISSSPIVTPVTKRKRTDTASVDESKRKKR